MAHPQSTSHESLTIAINLRKAANRLPYMNAERMAAFPLLRTHRCPRVLTQAWGRIATHDVTNRRKCCDLTEKRGTRVRHQFRKAY